MTLSLRAMRYVQAALQHGSITGAAEAMYVTPSAIAAALDQAETAFGMALVTRARAKGIFPTAAGREIGRRIDDFLERYVTLLSDVSDLHSNLSGTLTIGYNAPIAPAFLPTLAAEMSLAHPDVAFTFTEGDNNSVQKLLLDGKCDMIFFVEELPNPQIATQPLLFAPTYCLCPDDHALAQNHTVTVSQIVAEPLILLDRPAARGYYLDVLEQGGKDIRVVATANSTGNGPFACRFKGRDIVVEHEATGRSNVCWQQHTLSANFRQHKRCHPIARVCTGTKTKTSPNVRRKLYCIF